MECRRGKTFHQKIVEKNEQQLDWGDRTVWGQKKPFVLQCNIQLQQSFPEPLNTFCFLQLKKKPGALTRTSILFLFLSMLQDLPAFSRSLHIIQAVTDVISLGLATTVFPHAMAGAIFQVNKYSGKFQGLINPAMKQNHKDRRSVCWDAKLISLTSRIIYKNSDLWREFGHSFYFQTICTINLQHFW